MGSSTPLNLVVQGLWHLGTVTAACCARHHRVIGLDFDPANITRLQQGKAPVMEPGLNDLLAAGLAGGALSFTADPQQACAQADVLWVCYDTPVDENDRSDVEFVLNQVRRSVSHLQPGRLVLLSAQLPVGTCRQLESEFPNLRFACSPENLRLGKAIEVFEKAERIIVGIRAETEKPVLTSLLSPFTPQLIFMRTESAEMVKHALNAFLAVSVTFINEIARVCEQVGADAREVSTGLKSDVRIGSRAYLGPGGPFAGGTLARDVVTLTGLGQRLHTPLALIPAIKQSNDQHRGWNLQRLTHSLGSLQGKTVAVVGLTYKPGTDTLRRSAALELCGQLSAAGANPRAWDPVVRELPAEIEGNWLVGSVADALQDADALVVCTEWPQLRQVAWGAEIPRMRRPVVVDANRFLESELKAIPGLQYFSVGRNS